MNGIQHRQPPHPRRVRDGKAHGHEPAHGMAHDIHRRDAEVVEEPPRLGHVVFERCRSGQRQAAAMARHVHRDDTVRGREGRDLRRPGLRIEAHAMDEEDFLALALVDEAGAAETLAEMGQCGCGQGAVL